MVLPDATRRRDPANIESAFGLFRSGELRAFQEFLDDDHGIRGRGLGPERLGRRQDVASPSAHLAAQAAYFLADLNGRRKGNRRLAAQAAQNAILSPQARFSS